MTAPTATSSAVDPGFDLEFRVRRRAPGLAGGVWADGTVHGYRFQALVFPAHAADPAFDYGDSRISKLWVRRQADRKTVFNWDRGPDVGAADPEVAAVVDFLAGGLVAALFGP